MLKLLIIGVGGFVGAISRYALSGAAHARYEGTFPLGTLMVNVIGCLVIGIVMELADRSLLSPNTRMFLTIGLLGSFTTFSALGYETLKLLGDGDLGRALLNVLANVTLGLGAVILGRMAVEVAGV